MLEINPQKVHQEEARLAASSELFPWQAFVAHHLKEVQHVDGFSLQVLGKGRQFP